MARGVNKVILIGHLGSDPEVRRLDNGTAVGGASLAIGEKWKDKNTGEWKERTEWVRLVWWGKGAELAEQYCTKGMQLYVEGKLQTRKYTTTEGQERQVTEVRVDQFEMLGKRDGAANGGRAAEVAEEEGQMAALDDNDLPF